jgi:hypothetical protein
MSLKLDLVDTQIPFSARGKEENAEEFAKENRGYHWSLPIQLIADQLSDQRISRSPM